MIQREEFRDGGFDPSRRFVRVRRVRDEARDFAAQFALSHACWLIAYPLAGWAGATLGLPMTAIILAALAAVAIGIGFAVWPADDPEVLEHGHADLSADHPHLAEAGHGRRHAHAYVIDDMHAAWPRER